MHDLDPPKKQKKRNDNPINTKENIYLDFKHLPWKMLYYYCIFYICLQGFSRQNEISGVIFRLPIWNRASKGPYRTKRGPIEYCAFQLFSGATYSQRSASNHTFCGSWIGRKVLFIKNDRIPIENLGKSKK